MAKASAGGGKEYGSSEPGDAYDPPAAEDAPKDPETELQNRQLRLTQTKALEKRLQDEIGRLTAHVTAVKALDGQLSEAAIGAATHARDELTKFVTSGMKALDSATATRIENTRKATKAAIQKKSDAYQQAVTDREGLQTTVAKKQEELSDATKTYAAAKDIAARVKQATGDLQAMRQKVEALVKANDFAAAGFWLFELQENAHDAPTLDGAADNLTKAWVALQAQSTAAGVLDDDLTAANAKEAASKKAFDEATKNRAARILERLGVPADPKTAAS